MSLERIDHVEEGTGRLTSRISQEEMIQFLTIFLQRYQYIEDAYLTLANQKSIDLSEGIWLDYIGKLLNVSRDAMEDEEYRIALRTRISQTSADGTPNSIITLVKDFTEAVSVRYTYHNTRYATLIVDGQKDIGKALYNLVEEIRPAGVNLVVQSDFNSNAFYPVYELDKQSGEIFQTTSDGTTFEDFEVTFNGINFEEFRTLKESDNIYQPSEKGEQNTLYYEEGSVFQLTSDGTTFEDMESFNEFGVSETFKVLDPYIEGYIPENVRPLVWEVQTNSENMNND